jgi:hypothetical protein
VRRAEPDGFSIVQKSDDLADEVRPQLVSVAAWIGEVGQGELSVRLESCKMAERKRATDDQLQQL